MSVLDALAAALRSEGGLLADAVVDPPAGAQAPLGALAAAGPRAEGRADEVAFVVEAVHEGHLLHHGEPRVVSGADPDLALLVGDRLYALGLERLARAGDLVAVRALSDVISLAARAAATGDDELAAAAWEAGAAEVGWGAEEALEQAKMRARDGVPGASGDLRGAAAALRR